jgi:hypothetical protein
MKTYGEAEIQLHAVSITTQMEVSFASGERALSAHWAGREQLLTRTEH